MYGGNTGVYRCKGIKMYRGHTDVWRVYRCIGHTYIWEIYWGHAWGVHMYGGCTKVWQHRCMGMYKCWVHSTPETYRQ